MYMIIKNLLFKFHYHSSIFFTFGWVLYPRIVYLHYLVILSWLLNKNKCLLTQLEYYFFKETCMGKEEKYSVPKNNRYILYANCAVGTLYNTFNYIPLMLLVMYVYLYNNKDKKIQDLYSNIHLIDLFTTKQSKM